VKERLQVQSNLLAAAANTIKTNPSAATLPVSYAYKGNIDAIIQIWNKEGLRGVTNMKEEDDTKIKLDQFC
jgi:hypothetical protein